MPGVTMFLYWFVSSRCRQQTFVHTITSEQLFRFLSCLAGLMVSIYRLPFLVDFHRDLDLEFSRSNSEFAISQWKMALLPGNKKQTCQMVSRPEMWPSDLTSAMTLTLNFQGQMWNLLYLRQRWLDSHETKSKHVDWTLGLKYDHWVWPWSWPWPWIFKVKFLNCCISRMTGLIGMKQKKN